MPKWLGNRFGDAVPVAPTEVAPSAIYNLFDQYYMKQEGGYVPEQNVAATGGTEFTNGGYQYHFFDSTSGRPFNVSSAGPVQILVVGGGGGALVNIADHPVTVQNYTISCGAGGGGSSQPTVRGSNGSNTTACGIVAKGGGGGGSGTETGAGDSNDPFGGSGGGQSRNDSIGQGGTYGNNGGPSDGSSNGRGGGGGGAGGAGSPGPNSLKGGDGGPVPWCPGPIFPGMPTTWQTTVGPTGLFAGGGGGNNEPGSGYDISGGPGGGGTGTGSYQPGSNGLNNTGGGGGGTMSSGKTGGSGFVVIRYPE